MDACKPSPWRCNSLTNKKTFPIAYATGVIAISGIAGSGKDALANALKEYLQREHGAIVQHFAFADPLREIVALHKRIVAGHVTSSERDELPPSQNNRFLYQAFGGEIRRHDKDFFVSHVERRLEKCVQETAEEIIEAVESNPHRMGPCKPVLVMIVTDLRYKNELAFLEKYGAYFIRMRREGHEKDSDTYAQAMGGGGDAMHQSETDLDDVTLETWNAIAVTRDMNSVDIAAERFAESFMKLNPIQ